MTDDRKTRNPQNQTGQPQQNQTDQPKRGVVPDPLKKGMIAAGGHVLRGMGMSASAQQSGRGLGESSASRNWDAGGQPGQDERGTVSTGPDTAPEERARQQDEHARHEHEQQQQGEGVTRSGPQDHTGAGRPERIQPPLDETSAPDILHRNPDVTKR